MAKHALMSPSGAERWARCSGSVPLSADLPDESSKFAEEGSCAHEVAALCLTENHDAAYYVGKIFHETEVIEEMAEHVDSYVQTVHDYMSHPTDDLHVEVRLPITPLTGEPDAFGTADAVILSHVNQEIVVADLKYGKGVKVQADQNLQLAIYALAVLSLYGIVGDWKTVRLVIVQPRAGGVSEWVVSLADLDLIATEIRLAADRVRLAQAEGPAGHLNPGTKQCQWCRAKAICPALSAQVLEDYTVNREPAAATEIAHLLPRLDLIEGWVKSVRAEAERRLLGGIPIPGYKLVEGKRGNRAWIKPDQVVALLKGMRLKVGQMYDTKVISPTTTEKVLKNHPKRWARLQEHITQKAGPLTVAPADDRRPELFAAVSSSEFQAINA